MSSSCLGDGPPFETKSYVCIHVFERTRPILLVSRPDGDWCALCGDDHPQDSIYYRVVGLGHVVSQDPTIAEVLDLEADEEAERQVEAGPWVRSRF